MCTFFKSLLLLFQLTFYRMSLRVNKQANEVLAKSLQTSCEFEKNCSSLNPWLPILGLFRCPLVCSDAFIWHVISIKGMKFWLTIFLAPHLFPFWTWNLLRAQTANEEILAYEFNAEWEIFFFFFLCIMSALKSGSPRKWLISPKFITFSKYCRYH